jgi:hypothetical protein
MNRCRGITVLALAALGLISGCSGIGNGQLMCRMGFQHHCPCPCETAALPIEGGAPCCGGCGGGPVLEGIPPGGIPPVNGGAPYINGGAPYNGLPMIQPAPPTPVPSTTVPPMPRPLPDEAQPTPAGPTSKIK